MVIFLLLITCLTGCVFSPRYGKPCLPAPQAWSHTSCEQMMEEPWVQWWQVFDDPILDKLICKAVKCNLDLQIAKAKVKEARGMFINTQSSLWPCIGLWLNAGKYNLSDQFPWVVVSPSFNVYDGVFDAGWEIDLFGNLKKAESARAKIAASLDDRRNVLITLIAEVARSYVELRKLQSQMSVFDAIICYQNELLQFSVLKQEQMLSGNQEVLEATSALSLTLATQAALEEAVLQTMNRIAFLVSELPGTLNQELCIPSALPHPVCCMATGLPSSLLCRRPDIREAEQLLNAQTACVGVAVADFFPKLYLGALVGQLSLFWSQFFDAGNQLSIFEGAINWPLFQGGKVIGYYKAEKAKQKQALINYAKVVLSAFHEVENNLISQTKENERFCRYQQNVQQKCALMNDLQLLYNEGLASQFQLLQSKIDYQTAYNSFLESQASCAISCIALYKALGGGWEVFE